MKHYNRTSDTDNYHRSYSHRYKCEIITNYTTKQQTYYSEIDNYAYFMIHIHTTYSRTVVRLQY